MKFLENIIVTIFITGLVFWLNRRIGIKFKIRKAFSSNNDKLSKILLEILKFSSLLVFSICLILFTIISIECYNEGFGFEPTSEGIGNFIDFYYVPLYLLVVLFFLATLGVATAGVMHSNENIIEARKSRAAGYRPELYIPKFNLLFKIQEELGKKFLTVVDDHRHDEDIKLELLNVGKGVAKKVDYEFKFNYSEALVYIEKLDRDKNFEIILGKEGLLIKFLKEFSELQNISINFDNERNSDLISYVPDLAVAKRTIGINFPRATLFLFYIATLLLMKNHNIKKMKVSHISDIPNFPKLQLHLSYRDLDYNPHEKKFRFDLYSDCIELPLKDDNLIPTVNTITIEPVEISGTFHI
ncbi:MAG: hypothetical protein IPM14_09770 [bacterium]|nr:hypothetical protein [bacterium]